MRSSNAKLPLHPAIIEALHERELNPMPIVLENRGVGGGIRYINQFTQRSTGALSLVSLPPMALAPDTRANREAGQRVLADCRGNLSQAARRLGIHRRSLQRKLAKYPVRENS